MKEVKKKNVQCKIRVPLDKTSGTPAYNLCFYTYIDVT